MPHVGLSDIAVLLAAMAIAAPLARWLGIGTVLGYLAAGVALGPNGIPRVFSTTEAREILEIAEFGIVLLLFLIGLELRPRRLWSMRSAIFSLGGSQVAITAAILAVIAVAVRSQLADGALHRTGARALVDGVRSTSPGGDREISTRGMDGSRSPCCCFRTSRQSR